MGQKVNPVCMRIGIIRSWNSKWYANKKQFHKTLHQDIAIEEMIIKKLKDAGISSVEILRTANAVTINIHSAKPGMIIGRGGETIEGLKDQMEKKFGNKFSINIIEVKKPALDAKLVAESVAQQVTKRISYRRASKMAIDKTMEAGAEGIKIRLAGRLNGVEISRSEFFSQGKIPLHTFRADVDYASLPAPTTYGQIGIKVWIYKGLVFKKAKGVHVTEVEEAEMKMPEPGEHRPKRRPVSDKRTDQPSKKSTKSKK